MKPNTFVENNPFEENDRFVIRFQNHLTSEIKKKFYSKYEQEDMFKSAFFKNFTNSGIVDMVDKAFIGENISRFATEEEGDLGRLVHQNKTINMDGFFIISPTNIHIQDSNKTNTNKIFTNNYNVVFGSRFRSELNFFYYWFSHLESKNKKDNYENIIYSNASFDEILFSGNKFNTVFFNMSTAMSIPAIIEKQNIKKKPVKAKKK